ncbi:cell division protein CrgA [Oerskovia flava]|uniref:cell division protein CrgA n=1 Tax=Oerskovia flava TaxID=2986422 RepID=UPI00223EC85D|nr:cell division protein CrgA [Oerskovia sp. JB1-3-2]
MPESKSRKKKPSAPREPRATQPGPGGNPRWLVPTMLGLMLFGLAWIVLFYLSGGNQLPIPALGAWNLAVGFAFIIAGFGLTTRWR